MKERVSRLEKLVTSLTSIQGADTRFPSGCVAQQVNHLLRTDLDKTQQYTRRSCLVITGIPTFKGETAHDVEEKVKDHIVLHDLGYHQDRDKSIRIANEIAHDLDKVHRVGQRSGSKQAIIVKFKSHSKRTSLYSEHAKTLTRTG